MRYIITFMLALGLLLTGCGAGTALSDADGEDTTAQGSEEIQPCQLNKPMAPNSNQGETPVEAIPVSQRVENADNGRASIVKTLSGEGVSQIDIYAELCAVVLEKSPGDQIEAEFSFPEMAKPNYDNHFQLSATENGNTVSISTDYENQRWDTSFAPISGFDGERYQQTATLMVRLPEKQYQRVRLHLATAGKTLDIDGVDTAAMEIKIGTGDVVICTDRTYPDLSISHVVGNVTLRAPELGEALNVSSKIGVFTLSLPAEPEDVSLEINYSGDTASSGDEAIFVLPVSWDATVSGRTVRYERGAATKRIQVNNQLYGVFATEINGVETGEPASAR